MTPADLRERVEAATSGPWITYGGGVSGPPMDDIGTMRSEDCALIALAPDLALALVDAWKALESTSNLLYLGMDSHERIALREQVHAVLAKLEGLGA